jgi:hypothetical protein
MVGNSSFEGQKWGLKVKNGGFGVVFEVKNGVFEVI